MVRCRLAHRASAGVPLRRLQPQDGAVAHPRFLGHRPCRLVRDPAADHLRLGLCGHAAGALSDGGRATRNPLPRRSGPDDRAGACRNRAFVLRAAYGSQYREPGKGGGRPVGQAQGNRPDAARRPGHQPRRDDLPGILADAAQRAYRRDGHRAPRGLFQRPVAARGDQLARSQISRGRLFCRRPIAAGPSQPLPRPAPPDGRRLADAAAAQRFRLCLADRRAALQPRDGRRYASGLARAGVDPLQNAPMTALSIVVPCFNEEGCLDELHQRLSAAARTAVGADYELVLVNDGSRDGTWAAMQRIAEDDRNLVAIELSRHHGHRIALTAGLDLCRGDAILIIDADLQDPPELLGPMLQTMRESSADVVYGVGPPPSPETPLKRRATARVFP